MLVKSPCYLNHYPSSVLAPFVTRLPLISPRALSNRSQAILDLSLQFDKHQQGPTTDPTLASHLLQSHPRHFLLCTPKEAQHLT